MISNVCSIVLRKKVCSRQDALSIIATLNKFAYDAELYMYARQDGSKKGYATRSFVILNMRAMYGNILLGICGIVY